MIKTQNITGLLLNKKTLRTRLQKVYITVIRNKFRTLAKLIMQFYNVKLGFHAIHISY